MSEDTRSESSSSATRWHLLLGALLDPLLRPVGIEVLTELPVMNTPPKADILLLRRSKPAWSAEQQARLPDGIRDTRAGRILIEFKYTESVNEKALCQSIGYDYFYRTAQDLNVDAVQTVLASSRKPHKATLAALGYEATAQAGVFRSTCHVIRKVLLLSLNDLENTPHNATFKCFASRQRERRVAFETLHTVQQPHFSEQFWWIVNGLWKIWFFQQGGKTMSHAVTPEAVREMGKMWGKHYLESLSVEQRLAGLKPEEYLAGLKPEDRVAGLKPEDRVAGLTPEEIERLLRDLKKRSSDT
ncbi:MAG: hypothetical protein GY801_09515 [bacterium]|nr:hypothetical protein [bacterium]